MIIMKFGGTSNQDAAAMRNVICIVKSHVAQRPVVVISAIAKATNELEQAARTASVGKGNDAKAILAALLGRHNVIIHSLIKSRQQLNDLRAVFTKYHAELNQLVDGVAILKELTPRTMDAFCSYGERLSSRIIVAGLQEEDVTAVWVDAKEFMITDENFGRAQPLMDRVTANLENVVRPMLDAGKVPVTQGFIGVTQGGVYTTMGRESSDYSASIIGAAMNADKVQIWTDVDGILTADPTVVKSTKKINRMSFEEAFELSYFGAKVLHPNTMLPVIQKKIPVEILNSRNQNESGTSVGVEPGGRCEGPVLKSIAYRKDLSIITITPHTRHNQYVFWEGIFSVLTRHGITTGMMTTSEYNVALTIENRLFVDSLRHELAAFGVVGLDGGKGSICLVGRGMRGAAGLANRIFKALSGTNIAMVSFGASDMNLTVLIEESQITEAVSRLHLEFFDSVESSEIFEARNE